MSQAIPPPPPPPSPFGYSARPRIRWGIGDFFFAFLLVGLLVSVVAGLFVIDASKPVQLIVLIGTQNGAILLYLGLIARAKGLGSLRADFGFTLRSPSGSLLDNVRFFLMGVGLQLVALVPTGILVALHGTEAKQEVVKIADRAHGLQVPLLILAITVLAPVTEELLFRGTLLRSLLRRTGPDRAVLISATVFGVVHVLGDPSIGSLVALPVIMGLGVISGYQAVKTGTLSRSIMLHVGFNALTAILLFA